MKKRNAKKNGFYKDPKKQYLKKYRFYPTFLYYRLDKWLKDMSLKGWHIVHCGLLTFVFEKGESFEKEYFTYYFSARDLKRSVTVCFSLFEKKYGVKAKKSKINSNQKKCYRIVEIDTEATDIKNDFGYRKLVEYRDNLHKKHLIEGIIAFTIVLLVYAIAQIIQKL